VKLFSKNSNLRDHDISTSCTDRQTNRETDRETTCRSNTALCVASRSNLKLLHPGVTSRSHRKCRNWTTTVSRTPLGSLQRSPDPLAGGEGRGCGQGLGAPYPRTPPLRASGYGGLRALHPILTNILADPTNGRANVTVLRVRRRLSVCVW